MKKTLKRVLAAAASLSVLAGAVGTYGYFSDIVTVKNHISLGDVNIALKEYEQKNGQEREYGNPRIILPGDTVSKIPRIINYGEPCWVRVKISFGNDRENLEGFSEENLLGFTDEWVKQGEYYYYTRILGRMEKISLFSGVTVPWQWTEVHSDQELTVEIRAEAIQSANFSPDFRAMSPWGDQEIQLCVHEADGQEISREEHVKLSVEFQGDAHKLVAVPEDFFCNFQRAMPGDVLKDSAEISNTTSKDAEIFFHTGLICQRDDRTELLKKLGLTIKMNDRTIYSGDLPAKELSEEVSLGVFKPGESGILDFTVTVPAELDNEYALRDTTVKWYFTVYEMDDVPDETPSPRIVQEPEEPPREYPQEEQKASPKTGDDTPTGEWLLLLGVSLAACVTVLSLWKGGKKV